MSNYMEEIINDKINNIKNTNNVFETGRVVKVRDYIIEVSGLEGAFYFEEVRIGNKAIGYVSNIKTNAVIISIVKQFDDIYVNDEVSRTSKEFVMEFSTESMGNVIDIFGVNQLNQEKFQDITPLTMNSKPVSIMERRGVVRPLYTGVAGIDLLYPIGKGQRQLIIGDKKTGKTQIALDTINNQKGKNVICIYVSIGKTKKSVIETYHELAAKGAMEYTILLAATNDEKPPVLSLTPYGALAIAEKYMMNGQDVLVIIDDLTRHADAYREIALYSGKEPGRDAYPADIFYTHSRLLEKGCQHMNGGSITVLPICETRGGDITDYISTNIISITDGQIVLSKKSYDKGQKPAINYGLSVSRLGGAVQEKAVKNVGTKARRELLSYLETREIYELANIDEMGEELQKKLKQGQELLQNFIQYKYTPIDADTMVAQFSAIIED